MLERIRSWKESQTRMSWGLFLSIQPQEHHSKNGVVERAFVTVMGRARAMMNHAEFTMAKRQQLWCEAAQTATTLDNILVQESAKSPPFTQFFGVDAKYAKHLRVFGEMCVVADTDKKLGGPRLIQETRSVYLLGTALSMQEMSTDS